MVKLKRELEWECNHHMFYRYFCDVQIVKIMKQRWKSKTYTIFILYYNNDTRWANKEFNRNVLVVAENSSWNSVDLLPLNDNNKLHRCGVYSTERNVKKKILNCRFVLIRSDWYWNDFFFRLEWNHMATYNWIGRICYKYKWNIHRNYKYMV